MHPGKAGCTSPYLLRNNWKNIPGYRICKTKSPIDGNVRSGACDSELILNPRLSPLKTCDIQNTYRTEFDWSLIRTLDAWFYSVLGLILAKITSLNQPNGQAKLAGIGIIQLTPGFDLKTKEKSLPSAGTRTGSTEVLYEVPLHANLSILWTDLLEVQNLASVRIIGSVQGEEDTSKDEFLDSNAESCDELKHRLNYLSLEWNTRSNQSFRCIS